MAINETHIEAPPERVFAILADWRAYGHWVVGSSHMRGVDPGFPKAGTRFHHTVGLGPFKVSDHTQVVEVDQPRKLILRARARPLGTAIVDVTLEPEDGGTKVTLREDPGDPLTALVFQPLTHLVVRNRNVESLRRLKELAEERPEYGFETEVPAGRIE